MDGSRDFEGVSPGKRLGGKVSLALSLKLDTDFRDQGNIRNVLLYWRYYEDQPNESGKSRVDSKSLIMGTSTKIHLHHTVFASVDCNSDVEVSQSRAREVHILNKITSFVDKGVNPELSRRDHGPHIPLKLSRWQEDHSTVEPVFPWM